MRRWSILRHRDTQFPGRRTDYFLSDDLPRGRSHHHVPLGLLDTIRDALEGLPGITFHVYDADHAFANTHRQELFSAGPTEQAHAVVRSVRYASLTSYSAALQADGLYSEAEKHRRRRRRDGFRCRLRRSCPTTALGVVASGKRRRADVINVDDLAADGVITRTLLVSRVPMTPI